jgi:hypothetical protein
MKMNFMLAAVFSLFVLAFAASAQDKATNFSGTWNLDVAKSKLDERAHIETQTLTVTQTGKDLKVETATRHTPPPADKEKQDGGKGGDGGRMGGGGGRMRGGMMGGGDGTRTYTLDGKETKKESFLKRFRTSPLTKLKKTDCGFLILRVCYSYLKKWIN